MVKKMMLLAVLTIVASSVLAQPQGRGPRMAHPPRDIYQGWSVGTQAYTFNRFTFFEAVDKAASLGLSWIEAYPGQRLSKEKPNAQMIHTMDEALRQEVKAKLAENGIRLIAYGVVGLPNNEAECRKVFDFCKDMNIRYIASEPPEEAFDMLDKLAQEYEIGVAIHNHPDPSHYWNPDTVLKVCEGRSRFIGACADTGHWTRSDIDPLEAVKKLKDRILYFHFKDLTKFGKPHGHDVPWGTGVSKPRQILEYLNEQGWRGYFSVEYEHNWDNSVPEIRQCIHWFEDVAAELKPGGWKKLLAGDLSNTTSAGNWKLEDDVLSRANSGGDIWTKERYGNFILDLEFKVDPKTNSGVFIRTDDVKDPVQTGIEVQIYDSAGGGLNRNMCGAIYDCLAPAKNLMKAPGQWNHMTIVAWNNRLSVSMNGEQILRMDLDEWTEAAMNPSADKAPNTWPEPDGQKNKFRTAYKDMKREGHVGFQDHGSVVWYRNVKIRPIERVNR
ncbi:MAG: DUF1080 domain-containing protein [Sedimentisphaerales bacterium]|nr:DUF1080 domain-containing protein [Sedimentisphaerales bacterium]